MLMRFLTGKEYISVLFTKTRKHLKKICNKDHEFELVRDGFMELINWSYRSGVNPVVLGEPEEITRGRVRTCIKTGNCDGMTQSPHVYQTL